MIGSSPRQCKQPLIISSVFINNNYYCVKDLYFFVHILHHTINKLIWGRPLFYVSDCNMCLSLTSTLVGFVLKRIKAPITCIWSKDCLPTQATLGKPSFPTFPYKTWQTVYIRNKKLKKKGDPLALLARPTFLLKNTLAHPAMSTWSRQDNPSIIMRAVLPLALLARASFVHIDGGYGWTGQIEFLACNKFLTCNS